MADQASRHLEQFLATGHFPPSDYPIEYRVDIEMSWESAGVRRTSGYSTLLLREIPFGERLRREFTEREPNRSP